MILRRTYLLPKVLRDFVRTYWYRKGYTPPDVEPGLYPYPKRQVPECGRKSFQVRVAELTPKPTGFASLTPVDIGLPFKAAPLLSDHTQPKNMSFEKLARKRDLRIPLEEIHSLAQDTHYPLRSLAAAQHYEIFNALFRPPHFFVPQISCTLYYLLNSENEASLTENSATDTSYCLVEPVHTGNIITPSVASEEPLIDLSSASADFLWTLVMTCPDEPMGNSDGDEPANEYIHWMVANLPGGNQSDSSCGNLIVPYLQPLPYHGTGFHRYVFILYRQDQGRIDLAVERRSEAKGDLRADRTFDTLNFYRTYESQLTPAGLFFFQSCWDESVRQYFRNILDTHEPIFELEWKSPRLPMQERFPEANSWCRTRRHPHGIPLIRNRYGQHTNVSFDVYLDRYRDQKDLAAELVRERLANEGNPLNSDEPRRRKWTYPAAVPTPADMPTWLQRQHRQRQLRQGRWRYLEGAEDG